MSLRHTLLATSALAASAALMGCHRDSLPDPSTQATPPQPVGDTVAVTSSGKVVSFGRAPSATLTSSQPVQGLAGGESIIAIDNRPATNVVFALTNLGNLYVLNPSTGVASTKVALTANTTTPINTACMPAVAAYTALSGTEFGIDFNPSVDRLRIVSDTGQNLRVNVDNGMTTVDCPLLTGTTASNTTAAAYINSVTGRGVQMPADPTSLFYIDAATDQLLTTTAPNGGALTVVGALGVDAGAVNGFDISSTVSGTTFSNAAYAVLTVGGTTGFYSINLSSGAATVLANFSQTDTLRGLALK